MSKARGEYLDPALSRVTVAQLYDTWIIGKKSLKPSAFAQLPIAGRLHVEPKWGAREVGGTLPSEVRTWVTELTQDKPDGTKGRSATSRRPPARRAWANRGQRSSPRREKGPHPQCFQGNAGLRVRSRLRDSNP